MPFAKQPNILSLKEINQSSPEEVNNYLKKEVFLFLNTLVMIS